MMTTPSSLYLSDPQSSRALVKAESVTPKLKKQGSERLSACSRANSSWKAGMAISSPILSTLHPAHKSAAPGGGHSWKEQLLMGFREIGDRVQVTQW